MPAISKKTERAKKKFAEVLRLNANNIAQTCRKLKISRNTYTKLYETDKAFKEEIDEVMEGVIDHVESKLHEQINEGNVPAIIFFLKSKAKHRGYVDRELDTGSGVTQNFRIVMEDVKQIAKGDPDEITIRG